MKAIISQQSATASRQQTLRSSIVLSNAPSSLDDRFSPSSNLTQPSEKKSKNIELDETRSLQTYQTISQSKSLMQQGLSQKKYFDQFAGILKFERTQFRSTEFNDGDKKNSRVTSVQLKNEERIRLLTEQGKRLRNQCEVYQSMINSMNLKIQKLEYQNKQLTIQLRDCKIQKIQIQKTCKLEKMEVTEKLYRKINQDEQMLKELKEKTNNVMELYCSLQSKANQSDIEWTIWKEKWGSQKKFYLQKIQVLEKKIYNLQQLQSSSSKNITIAPYKRNQLYKQPVTDRSWAHYNPQKNNIYCEKEQYRRKA